MENATKALLIAASVLIVIVLIAIGVNILGSSQDVTNSVDEVTHSTGLAYFNSQFTDYTGTQNGAQVKAVLNKAAATWRNDSVRNVKVTKGGTTYDSANEIAQCMSSIVITSTYTVGVQFDSDGYVQTVTIQ